MTSKILIDRDVVEQALDALEFRSDARLSRRGRDAIVALSGALEQQKQEPVAWMGTDIEGTPNKFRLNPFGGGVPLYTHPPRREWVSLTDEEIECEWAILPFKSGWLCFARSIEAALKEKNA